MEQPRSGSDRIAELLGEEPELDEVTRARMEKNLLAAVAAGEHLAIAETPFAVEMDRESSAPRDISSGRRSWGAMAFGTVAAAAAAAALVWASGVDEANDPDGVVAATFLRHEAGATVDRGNIEQGAEVATADGERVEVRVAAARVDVTPGSAVRFDRIDASRVEVFLTRGAVDVELHPARRGDQTLRVTTEAAFVDVVGTVFTVEVTDRGDTEVSTVEGTVRVTPRGEGEAQLVAAGEQMTITAMATEPAAGEGGEGPSGSAPSEGFPGGPSDEAAAEVTELPGAGDPAAIDETVGEAAGEGQGDDADDVDPAASATEPPSASDRLRRAEALLDGGNHGAAQRMLESVAASAPQAEQRVRAHTLLAESFTAQRSFRSAADAYGRAVDEGGRSMGAQNALYAMARLFERQMRAPEAAKAAYRDYLRLAPEGAHAVRVKRALCGLGEAEYCE